jgi:hypothetical protein
MKKTYEKPVLVRAFALPQVTAQPAYPVYCSYELCVK